MHVNLAAGAVGANVADEAQCRICLVRSMRHCKGLSSA